MAVFDIETNAALVATDLVAVGVKAGAKAFVVTKHWGGILRTAVMRNADLPRTAPRGENTGGPRNMTGDYLRSIGPPQMSLAGGGPTATVGSNAPQARRLEFGYYDTDSRGYRYEQPPYAHWGPALDEVEPAFVAAIAAIAVED